MSLINFFKKLFGIPTQKEINEANALIREQIVKNKEQKKYTKKYFIKQKYISNCEIEYGNVIKQIIGNSYILYPQVPLSQIVIKKSNDKYQNELYRIIDFCIFSKEYTPLLCIEINDKTHHQKERYRRDNKVKDILSNAGLPLLTLWTEYGINVEYIQKRLKENLII